MAVVQIVRLDRPRRRSAPVTLTLTRTLTFDALCSNHYGGYYYYDEYIRRFTHTHLVGAGLIDYGNIGVMPVPSFGPTQLARTLPSLRRSRFVHSTN